MAGKRRTAVIITAGVLLAVCVVPLHAVSAEPPPPSWVGSYWGFVTGESGMQTGETPCTIWIESIGAKRVRVSIQVTGLPLLAAEGVYEQDEPDREARIRLEYGGSGVDVGAQVRMVPTEGGWAMAADGAGRAFGLQGHGRAQARQYYKYIAMPSFAEQVAGTVDALLGRPSRPAGFPETGAEEPPPPSIIAPSDPRPPLTLADMLAISFWQETLMWLFFCAA